MKKLGVIFANHPILTGFLLIVLFIILSILTWPISQINPTPEGYETGTAIAKLVMAACFTLILLGVGWIKTAGYASLGGTTIWLWVIAMMVYKVLCLVPAFMRKFQYGLPAANLTLAVLFFTFATSLLEESMYRGVLLTAMVKAWGSTRRGLFAAAFLSGVFWGAMHLVNLAVRPFSTVGLQVLETALSGFVYAAIVLYGRSIWPAVVFHAVVNASVGLQVIQTPNFEDTPASWLLTNLVTVLLVPAGIYLLRKVSLMPRERAGSG